MPHTKYEYHGQKPAVIQNVVNWNKSMDFPTRYSELHKISVEIENFYALCTF